MSSPRKATLVSFSNLNNPAVYNTVERLPGWARHVDRDTAQGIDEFAAWVALRDVLASFEVSLGDAFYEGIEGFLVHLRAGNGGGGNRKRRWIGNWRTPVRRLYITPLDVPISYTMHMVLPISEYLA